MSDIPQWLEDVAEYDYIMWELGRMRDMLAARSPLTTAIDVASGYEDKMRATAEELMRRGTELRRLLENVE